MRKYLLSILFVLLPAMASAQATAVRPGTVREITAGTTDNATLADLGGWIEWRSPADANKTEILPLCNAPSNGFSIGVADGRGNAGTRNISVQAVSGQTTSASISITHNDGSAQFVCNGDGNWIVASHFAGSVPATPAITGITLTPDRFVANGTPNAVVGELSATTDGGPFNGTFSISSAPNSNPGNLFWIAPPNTLRALAAATAQTYMVRIRATQSNATNSPHDVEIPVTGTGPLPTVISESANAVEGQSFSYEIRANCQGSPCTGGNAITSFNVTSPLPAGLSQTGPLGEFISGVLPATQDFNIWSLSLSAMNANGAGRGTLTLRVRPPS